MPMPLITVVLGTAVVVAVGCWLPPTGSARCEVTFTLNPATGRPESIVVFPKPGPYMVMVMGRALPGKNLPAFILTAIIVVEPG